MMALKGVIETLGRIRELNNRRLSHIPAAGDIDRLAGDIAVTRQHHRPSSSNGVQPRPDWPGPAEPPRPAGQRLPGRGRIERWKRGTVRPGWAIRRGGRSDSRDKQQRPQALIPGSAGRSACRPGGELCESRASAGAGEAMPIIKKPGNPCRASIPPHWLAG